MSQTFSLICRETKQKIWIGQGWGKMQALYTGMPAVMERLRRFLNAHEGKSLEFVMDDTEANIDDDGWREFEDPEPDETDR